MIKQCKKCGSKNLYLEPRIKGQNILTADMVALKCKDCGKWIKWSSKKERGYYFNLEITKDCRIKQLKQKLKEFKDIMKENVSNIAYEELQKDRDRWKKLYKEQVKI